MKRAKGKDKNEKNDCMDVVSESTDTKSADKVEQQDTNMAARAKPFAKKWDVISGLYSRQQGLLNPSNFVKDACGSHLLVGRLKQLKPLAHHNGCVNTLHFSPSGDLLASGSDDLDIAIWDWAKHKKVLSYDSGHASNVFQVSSICTKRFVPNFHLIVSKAEIFIEKFH